MSGFKWPSSGWEGDHLRQSRYEGRTNLEKAARKRLNDAKVLLAQGPEHSRGAAYLGGYAIECKLKAIAMEVFSCWTLKQLANEWSVDDRDVYTHGLEALLSRLPQTHRIRRSPIWRDFVQNVNHWRVAWRYDPSPWPQAGEFLKAVERVYHWLDVNR